MLFLAFFFCECSPKPHQGICYCTCACTTHIAFLGFLYTGFCFVRMPAIHSLTILWRAVRARQTIESMPCRSFYFQAFSHFFEMGRPSRWDCGCSLGLKYIVLSSLLTLKFQRKSCEAVFLVQLPAKSAKNPCLKSVRLKKIDPTKIMHLIVHYCVWVS